MNSTDPGRGVFGFVLVFNSALADTGTCTEVSEAQSALTFEVSEAQSAVSPEYSLLH